MFGALLAVALSASAVPALALPLPASCCCAHRGEKLCHCPACEHARELESGEPRLGTCARQGVVALTAAPMTFSIAASPLVTPCEDHAPAQCAPAALVAQSPGPEVEKPPPLA